LKLSKFVNEEFLAPVIGLIFYSLVYSTYSPVYRICLPKYRNIPYIPVPNSLIRKIAGPPIMPLIMIIILIIWLIIIATDIGSSCTCIKNIVANQKHYSRGGKTLSDIILFVFLSFL
jgi:hypothetical protein